MYNLLLEYANTKSGLKMTDFRQVASLVLEKNGVVEKASTVKTNKINGKDMNANEYAVKSDQIRALFKRKGTEDKLPVKQRRTSN